MSRMNGANPTRTLAAATFLAVLSLISPAVQAEEGTLSGVSTWHAEGQTFQTNADEATFVGAFVGQFRADGGTGPFASGVLQCPAVVTFDTRNGAQHGDGRCIITTADGAKLFAKLSCVGTRLAGCAGALTLTGGTGHFTGITGNGTVAIKTDSRQFSVTPDYSVKEKGVGTTQLRDVRYRIPNDGSSSR